jgi:hypothetical protein
MKSARHIVCSSKHALRPYLYLLIHWPLATAASQLAALAGRKYLAFYIVRGGLSMLGAILDTRFVWWANHQIPDSKLLPLFSVLSCFHDCLAA